MRRHSHVSSTTQPGGNAEKRAAINEWNHVLQSSSNLGKWMQNSQDYCESYCESRRKDIEQELRELQKVKSLLTQSCPSRDKEKSNQLPTVTGKHLCDALSVELKSLAYYRRISFAQMILIKKRGQIAEYFDELGSGGTLYWTEPNPLKRQNCRAGLGDDSLRSRSVPGARGASKEEANGGRQAEEVHDG